MKNSLDKNAMSVFINETVFEAFPNLESERLCFRAYKKEDAETLFQIRAHKDVSKYMDSAPLQTIEESEQRILIMQKAFNESKGITWAVIDKKSNTLIGDFGIWKLDRQNSRGEIGYVLHPDFWGKGYMKETMNTIIRYAFNDFNLHSLAANVNTENTSSKTLLLKFGFKLEAHFRENYFYNGHFLDSEIYCLIKSDLE
jgi:ribosomal-protein-alanine N-acetyltransferase